LKAGDTIKSDHLFIVCTGPLSDGSVPAFNLTTQDWDSDHTCVVQVGEHRYVDRPSVVAYKFGELLTLRRIERLQLLAPQDYGLVSIELLQRIQQGALHLPKRRAN
jgi:hypothetical protein